VRQLNLQDLHLLLHRPNKTATSPNGLSLVERLQQELDLYDHHNSHCLVLINISFQLMYQNSKGDGASSTDAKPKKAGKPEKCE
jgi:hypothetical protein